MTTSYLSIAARLTSIFGTAAFAVVGWFGGSMVGEPQYHVTNGLLGIALAMLLWAEVGFGLWSVE